MFAILPVSADPDDSDMMARMMEFVCRANFGLGDGKFDFDPDDGEIGITKFVDCKGSLPGRDIIENSVFMPAFIVSKYAEGILDVIHGKASAKNAVEACETAESEAKLLAELDELENELKDIRMQLNDTLTGQGDYDAEDLLRNKEQEIKPVHLFDLFSADDDGNGPLFSPVTSAKDEDYKRARSERLFRRLDDEDESEEKKLAAEPFSDNGDNNDEGEDQD